MKYVDAYQELLRQGFKFAGNPWPEDMVNRMVKVRNTYNVVIDIVVKRGEKEMLFVTGAFKYIVDHKTGHQFARHSVFDAKSNLIHPELSEEQLTALAYAITSEAFCGVLDKGGRPYFEHCLAVSRKLGPVVSESYKQIAVMHDLLEDIKHYSTLVLDDLGFSNFVYMSVFYLSKLKTRSEIHTDGKVDLEKYMTIIMQHRSCLYVKMSDLQHNSDLRRLKGVSERDFERSNNYSFWYYKLKEHGISQGWI